MESQFQCQPFRLLPDLWSGNLLRVDLEQAFHSALRGEFGRSRRVKFMRPRPLSRKGGSGFRDGEPPLH
jgi:hypothetical protein